MKEIKVEIDGGWGGGVIARVEEYDPFGTGRPSLRGDVCPICEWEKSSTGEHGWSYLSASMNHPMDEFIEDETRVLFSFQFIWRGCWESRIYPSAGEYWGSELRTMADVWDKLAPVLKEELMKVNSLAREYGVDEDPMD